MTQRERQILNWIEADPMISQQELAERAGIRPGDRLIAINKNLISDVLDYRCTGKFRQSDGIEHALKVIQKDIPFKYTRDNESNIITIL